MSLERFVNTLIEEAMQRGEFDHLPGAGQPIDLSAYFATPEDVRLAYAVLKNAKILPAEVEWLHEIAQLQEKLQTATDESKKRQILRAIEERRLAYRLRMEHRRGR